MASGGEHGKKFAVPIVAVVALLLAAPVAGVAQAPDTVQASATEDLSWTPAVGEDGVIRWGAARTGAQQPVAWERRAAPNIFQVVATEQRGSFVVLEDGTRWEVFLPHRPGTATWQAGDHVLMQLAPVRRGSHTYRMQNGERDDVAIVRFAGMAPEVPDPGLPPTPPSP